MNKLKVRWTDKEGKSQYKMYDNEKLARQARDWLLKNGADDADIAIVIERKEEDTSV